MLERKFGIAAYDYWYGYSAAQIDLMTLDGMVIDYNAGKKKGLGNSRKDKMEMDDLADAWAKKKASEGSAKGESISLSEFVGKKI